MRLILQKLAVVLLFAASFSASAEPTANSVSFKITEVSSKTVGDVQEKEWLANYQSTGETAQFRIVLQLKQPSGNSPFTFSKGSIEHIDGSNPQTFLRHLTTALMAEGEIARQPKVDKLPLDIAILGIGMSRAGGTGQLAGGGFATHPAGSWIVTKVFLAEGEAEVYLNLDPVSGVGEFSLKDPGYGNVVIQELSRVL